MVNPGNKSTLISGETEMVVGHRGLTRTMTFVEFSDRQLYSSFA